jgi:hypothetical protein
MNAVGLNADISSQRRSVVLPLLVYLVERVEEIEKQSARSFVYRF